MADARINALTEATSLDDADWLVAEVGDSEARKVSVETLRGAMALFDAYALLRDEKAANTEGGGFTSGAWQTRTLNTIAFDPQSIVSLSTNRFTLQAGSYFVWARAPALRVSGHKAKILNYTDTTDALIGANQFNSATESGCDSVVQGRITIASAKEFELQHRCTVTKATNGLGTLLNLGVIEVYSEVMIWREAE